ncbi:hypothetical protein G4V62_16380 [Bacillaceae bacterium SIJ1]|uniref:hypothetical protein n=1 Tax=Litoribacterium kuwaitense TaxID=1398745 RepID=UPI0013EA48A0|nr:hypothetical protein [Litoribacterium kuwaitense]NGP46447.1 hypothetical protein [Litoribacterium kuwaitense]
MHIIKAYYLLNIKMFAKELVTLLSSLLLPSLFLLMNQESIYSTDDLRFYWAFILLTSYAYGVGIHAVRLKNEGA